MKLTTFAAFIAAVGFALPAQASPSIKSLFAAIRATGTRIVADDPQQCKDKSLMGKYTYIKNIKDEYLLCVANHRGDSAALYDTILHEAVHVAQACKGGPLYSYRSIIQAAQPNEIQMVGAGYPNRQFNAELEARVIAREQDEVFVKNLITQHCK